MTVATIELPLSRHLSLPGSRTSAAGVAVTPVEVIDENRAKDAFTVELHSRSLNGCKRPVFSPPLRLGSTA